MMMNLYDPVLRITKSRYLHKFLKKYFVNTKSVYLYIYLMQLTFSNEIKSH